MVWRVSLFDWGKKMHIFFFVSSHGFVSAILTQRLSGFIFSLIGWIKTESESRQFLVVEYTWHLRNERSFEEMKYFQVLSLC